MSDTGDGEEEWEEQYVAVELVGMIDPDKLTLCTVDNTAILVSVLFTLSKFEVIFIVCLYSLVDFQICCQSKIILSIL